jgi:hypothetical protein
MAPEPPRLRTIDGRTETVVAQPVDGTGVEGRVARRTQRSGVRPAGGEEHECDGHGAGDNQGPSPSTASAIAHRPDETKQRPTDDHPDHQTRTHIADPVDTEDDPRGGDNEDGEDRGDRHHDPPSATRGGQPPHQSDHDHRERAGGGGMP